MLNLVIALKLWARDWAHSTVRFFCDNLAVVQVVRTGKTRDDMLALCLKNIWLITASHDVDLHIDHIQGRANVVADLLSRIHSPKAVDSKLFEHICGIFAPPGAHLLIKWTKTLQHHKSYHWIQLPSIHNKFLCPVRALRALIASRPLPPSSPLFANNFHPYAQVIDTHIRDTLRKVLAHRNMTSRGHGFHTFRRSAATLAFDNNVQIQKIVSHGLWRSSAIWTYLENASQAPSIIPTTFAKVIPSCF